MKFEKLWNREELNKFWKAVAMVTASPARR